MLVGAGLPLTVGEGAASAVERTESMLSLLKEWDLERVPVTEGQIGEVWGESRREEPGTRVVDLGRDLAVDPLSVLRHRRILSKVAEVTAARDDVRVVDCFQ